MPTKNKENMTYVLSSSRPHRSKWLTINDETPSWLHWRHKNLSFQFSINHVHPFLLASITVKEDRVGETTRGFSGMAGGLADT